MDHQFSVFHVDLRHAEPGQRFVLKANGQRCPLRPHDDRTRELLRAIDTNLADNKSLTHFTPEPVQMPRRAALRIHVANEPDGDEPRVVHHAYIHIPKHPLGPDDDVDDDNLLEKAGKAISRLGDMIGDLGSDVPESLDPDQLTGHHHHHHHHHHVDWIGTAKAFLFHHPDLATKDPKVSKIVMEHMDQHMANATYQKISALAQAMSDLGAPGQNSGWAHLEEVTYNHAPPPHKRYMHQPVQQIVEQAGDSMTAVLTSTRNDLRLHNKKWFQETGAPVADGGHKGLHTAQDEEKLAVLKVGDAPEWSVKLGHTDPVEGLQTSISVTNAAENEVKVSMKNTLIRYLGIYVQFLDNKGKPLKTPDWKPEDAGVVWDVIDDLKMQYDDLRFLGYIQPINAFMAIPIQSDPGTLDVTFKFPPEAASAVLYGCGLAYQGRNEYPKSALLGGVLTGVACLGVPTFMLAFEAAAQDYEPLYKLLKKKKVIAAAVGAGVVYFGARFAKTGAVDKKMDWRAFSSLMQTVFSSGGPAILEWVEAQITAEEVADEIPFAGWIIVGIDVATGLAQIAETLGAIYESQWMIPNSVQVTAPTKVTVHPDPRRQAWPAIADHAVCTTRLIYKSQKRQTLTHHQDIAADYKAPTISTVFDNTLGGEIKVEVEFQVDGWVAAKATSGWIPNDDADAANMPPLFLVEFPVPLNSHSIYKHSSLLTWNGAQYDWDSHGAAPTATHTVQNTSATGNAISHWHGLALSQRHAFLAWSWKAAGLGVPEYGTENYDLQLDASMTASIPQRPMDGVAFVPCGLLAGTNVVVDSYPAKFLMKHGNWVIDKKTKRPEVDPKDHSWGAYYIDSRKASLPVKDGGGHHLRRIEVDGSGHVTFPTGNDLESWGRFPSDLNSTGEPTLGPPTKLALHPSGHVVAVNSTNHKLYVLQLPDRGMDDKALPLARAYAGRALDIQGSRGRAGLLIEPQAVACTGCGTILVLEMVQSAGFSNSRLQAFDMNGNPASVFKRGSQPTPFLQLPTEIASQPVTYLDITAVGSQALSYVWILYYTGSGAQASDYHMGLYRFGTKVKGDSGLLVTTHTVPAARLVADMWHTVYTLNYPMTTDGQGADAGPKNAHTGPAGRTVPSLSEWLPPVPHHHS